VVGSLQSTGLRPTFLHKFEKRGVALPATLFSNGRSAPAAAMQAVRR
jgi:hypothetical protein